MLITGVYAYDAGNTEIETQHDQHSYGGCLWNNLTLTIPSGYAIQVSSLSVYAGNVSNDVTISVGLYDSGGSRIVKTNDLPINGAAWYTGTVTTTILSGTYYIGANWADGSETFMGTYTPNGAKVQSTQPTLPVQAAWSAWDGYHISAYMTYEFIPLGGDPAIWAGVYTGGLMLMLFGSVLMFKYNIPILGFIYGIFTIGMGTTSIMNSNTLFSPYLEFGIFTISSLLMFYSVKRGLNK